MTISSTTRKAGPYVGNSVATSFAFAFKVFATSDIVVTLTVVTTGVESTLVLTTNYTVSLNADQNTNPGGSVTYNPSGVPMASTHKLTITSAVPQTQGTDITNGGGFYPEVIEDALDKAIIVVQQETEKIARTLKVSVSDTAPLEIPSAAARALKFLAFDASGNPIASSTAIGATPVSAFMETVVDDTTAAAAMATLEAGTMVTGQLRNVGLYPNMLGNVNYINLQTAAGLAATATSPISIGFRDVNAALGGNYTRKVTEGITVNISAGSTLGTVSGQISRIWVAAIDNAGTVELAAYNALSGVEIAGFNEAERISTIAEGGVGGADLAWTWYSKTARTNVPFTIIGYFESTQAVAGTWATNASLTVANPQQRPGDVLKASRVAITTVATGTTLIPNDNTIPQITEGDQLIGVNTITPTSAANILNTTATMVMAHSVTSTSAMALFRDTTANALATTAANLPANNLATLTLDHTYLAGSIAATGLRVRVGGSAAGTTTLNGVGGAQLYGGTLSSFIETKEIMA